MKLSRWLFGALLLLPLAAFGGAEHEPAKDQQLIVAEAEAIVELYDIRLHNVKMKSKEEDLKWDLVKENFERMTAAEKAGAITEHAMRDARYDYNYWLMQDQVKDIAEAETNLKIAKVRLEMAHAGMRPYGKISDIGQE